MVNTGTCTNPAEIPIELYCRRAAPERALRAPHHPRRTHAVVAVLAGRGSAAGVRPAQGLTAWFAQVVSRHGAASGTSCFSDAKCPLGDAHKACLTRTGGAHTLAGTTRWRCWTTRISWRTRWGRVPPRPLRPALLPHRRRPLPRPPHLHPPWAPPPVRSLLHPNTKRARVRERVRRPPTSGPPPRKQTQGCSNWTLKCL